MRSFTSLFSLFTRKGRYKILNELVYKVIEDFEEYAVTDCGKVISFKYKEPRIMKTWNGSSGYKMLKLTKNKKIFTFQVHRLVALTFLPNPDNKEQVHHIDNDKMNNHLHNLQWVTAQENIAFSHNTMPPTRNFIECELHHNTKGFIKSFSNKKEACDYAHKHHGCSSTSLMKYLKSKDYKLVLNV